MRGASLRQSGRPSRGKARARAVLRGKAHAVEESDAFGRRIREGDLPPPCPRGQAPENEAPQGPRFQEQTASRQRRADEATRVLRKEPQGTALVAALSRGPYGRPQGRHEVKSPRHLQLRWRPSDSSDGGEAGCPSALVAPGPPGSKRWVSAPSPGHAWSRESGVTVETRRLPLGGGGHGPSVRLLSGRRRRASLVVLARQGLPARSARPHGWERQWLRWARR